MNSSVDDSINDATKNKPSINNNEARINNIKKEAINMICRQTDYDYENARERLEAVDYNYIKVLNEFFGVTPTTVTNNHKSTNQQIYGEIRNLMDSGARRFRLDQEYADKYNEMMSQNNKVGENKIHDNI
jgi:hypothetical protein